MGLLAVFLKGLFSVGLKVAAVTAGVGVAAGIAANEMMRGGK